MPKLLRESFDIDVSIVRGFLLKTGGFLDYARNDRLIKCHAEPVEASPSPSLRLPFGVPSKSIFRGVIIRGAVCETDRGDCLNGFPFHALDPFGIML